MKEPLMRLRGRSVLHALVVVLAVAVVLTIVFWPEQHDQRRSVTPGVPPDARDEPEVFRIPHRVLLGADFVMQSPPEAPIVKELELPEPAAVRMIFPVTGRTVLGDDWPLHPEMGLTWDGVLKHWTSLAPRKRYRMTVRYADGPAPLRCRLYLNTGLTGPSARPSNTPANDTLWLGPEVTMAPGSHETLELDFSNAQAFNVEDNPAPHTGHDGSVKEGDWAAINQRDLNELSNIGLVIQWSDHGHDGKKITLEIEGPVTKK